MTRTRPHETQTNEFRHKAPAADAAPSWSSWLLSADGGEGGADSVGLAVRAVVPPAVRELRAQDLQAPWSFLRGWVRNGAGGAAPAIVLWIPVTEAAREPVLAVLCSAADTHGLRVAPAAEPDAVPVGFSGPPDEVAVASSELALDIAVNTPAAVSDRTALRMALHHLLQLVAHVPATSRRAFLFHCWESWSRAIDSAQRKAAAAAAREPGSLLADALRGPGTGTRTGWSRYLAAVRDAVANGSAPSAYQLHWHAHLTHNRLGVPAAVEACAALSLRTALAENLLDGDRDAPLGVPARPRPI